ncbi:MAG: sulfotransferase domain-containing protein [Chloroflexota bacterium]
MTIANNLPNLFVVGAAKSGTTGLYATLNTHPQVFFPQFKKELRFFSDDANYNKGLDWLAETYFKGAESYPVRGDGTPHYLYWSDKVAPRIYQVLGNSRPKIMAILREPASRAYSHYWLGIRLHGETLPFEEALAKEEERLREQYEVLRAEGRIRWGYFRGGCYATQLKPFFDLFPREDILVLLQEDLRGDFASAASRLTSFLNLDPAHPLELKVVNEAGEARFDELQEFLTHDAPIKSVFRKLFPKSLRDRVRRGLWRVNRRSVKYEPMAPETEAKLRQRYLPEVQELERMTGLSLKHWYPR